MQLKLDVKWLWEILQIISTVIQLVKKNDIF